MMLTLPYIDAGKLPEDRVRSHLLLSDDVLEPALDLLPPQVHGLRRGTDREVKKANKRLEPTRCPGETEPCR